MPHFPPPATTASTVASDNNDSPRDAQQPKRFMLISNPRTCSNLLVRILALEQQPHTKHGSYHFLECTIAMCANNMWEQNTDAWTEEQKQTVHKMYQDGIENLERDVTPDDDTKICFTKEHVETFTEPTALGRFVHGEKSSEIKPWTWEIPGYASEYSASNQTIFPDAYLESWNPIFLVRHPARAFESIYRSIMDVSKTPIVAEASEESIQKLIESHMTLSWTRDLYEWYGGRGFDPIVIDAEDVVVNTEALTQRLARYIGFDGEKLQYSWNECGQDVQAKQEAHVRRMLSSLNESKGVKADPSKLSSHIKSAEELLPKWTEEFGEQTANHMKRWVEGAMPDYEYLRERRMRP